MVHPLKLNCQTRSACARQGPKSSSDCRRAISRCTRKPSRGGTSGAGGGGDGGSLVIQVIVPSGNARAGIKTGDILHLVSGGGQERTESEYRALFDAADLRLVRVYPTTSSFSILEGVPT